MTATSDYFPTDAAGLTPARAPMIVDVADGEELTLTITPVAKKLGDDTVRMLAYNGSVPGPALRVRQGTEIVVHAVNYGDLEATVHWHGLRLDNQYDGTTETQAPIPIGGRFSYRLSFPDPGIYWYHPHIREDYGQEMGLCRHDHRRSERARTTGRPADREISLVLDDVLLEDGRIAPFSRSETTFAAMGRFGNVLLANGEPNLQLGARQGEIVRCYLVEHREHARLQRRNPRRPDEARRRRQRTLRARADRRRRHPRSLGTSDRRRLPRGAGRSRTRAPHARPHLHPRHDPRRRGAAADLGRLRIRRPADERRHGRRA